MKKVATPVLLAAVSQLQDNGRYQADGCTHTLLFKLYSDGRVISQTLRETREGRQAFTDGKRRHNLSVAMKKEGQKPFADEWAKMYRAQDFDRLNPYQLKKLQESEE